MSFSIRDNVTYQLVSHIFVRVEDIIDVAVCIKTIVCCGLIVLSLFSLTVEQFRYYCSDPIIDASTQREEGCSKSYPYVKGL